MLRLHIELLSPLCAGSGLNRPGLVDRDVVVDTLGLPRLPARRLKGLWRDAYRELYESAAVCSFWNLVEEDALFGAIGARFQDKARRAPFSLADAELPDAAGLAPWLRYVFSLRRRPFRPSDVLAELTEIRRQTRIDRTFARAADETLRATRLLRRGLTFHAPVIARRPFSEFELLSLGLAAAGIQSMGASRNRGFGQVRCRLVDDSRDWTNDAIELLRQDNPPEFAPAEPVAVGHATPALPPAPADPTPHRLRFLVRLQRPAVFPKLAGDPFTVATEDFVPGSTIRGLLANRYLDQAGGVPGETFYRLFCGAVRFGCANPVAPKSGGKPAFAVPASIRRIKGEEGYVDLAADPDCGKQVKRVSGWCEWDKLATGAASTRFLVSTRLVYHHARAADRRIQRAIGEEDAHSLEPPAFGALFTYESVDAGQSFAGELTGSAADLGVIQALVESSASVDVGRSKSAQYGGGAQWTWTDPSPAPLATLSPSAQLVGRAVVTLASSLIGVNAGGHPDGSFPAADIAEILGVSVHVNGSFTRTEMRGGYLSHLGLPRQQMPALAAGSVFVIDFSSGVDSAKLAALEAMSFGLRTEDGFGRISVRPATALPNPALVGPAPGELPRQEVGPGGPRRNFALALLRARVLEAVRLRGLELTAAVGPNDPQPAPHLLSRLLRMLESGADLDAFSRLLAPASREPAGQAKPAGLKQTARRQLQRCWVNTPQGVETLEDLLSGATKFAELIAGVFEASPWFLTEFGANPLLNGDQAADPLFRDEVLRAYFTSILTGMALRQRAAKRSSEKSHVV